MFKQLIIKSKEFTNANLPLYTSISDSLLKIYDIIREQLQFESFRGYEALSYDKEIDDDRKRLLEVYREKLQTLDRLNERLNDLIRMKEVIIEENKVHEENLEVLKKILGIHSTMDN